MAGVATVVSEQRADLNFPPAALIYFPFYVSITNLFFSMGNNTFLSLNEDRLAVVLLSSQKVHILISQPLLISPLLAHLPYLM